MRAGITGRSPAPSKKMLAVLGNPRRNCTGLTRRAVLQAAGTGLFGLSLPKILAAEAARPIRRARAKSVMFVFLFGGPSQLETFDMKPDDNRPSFDPVYNLAQGNVDRDGLPDLVVGLGGPGKHGVKESFSGRVIVARNVGHGRFVTESEFADRVRDIVTANYRDRSISLLKGNGDGTFQPAVVLHDNEGHSGIVVQEASIDQRPTVAELPGPSTQVDQLGSYDPASTNDVRLGPWSKYYAVSAELHFLGRLLLSKLPS